MTSHDRKTRRICWIMLACHALPKGHPVRVERFPKLVKELAVHARKAPSWRPN